MTARGARPRRPEVRRHAARSRVPAPPAAVWLIFAVALVLRVLYVLSIHDAFFFHRLQTEPLHYHRWATLILDGPVAPLPPFEQSPGYAYFVALVYALFGRSLTAVACVQAVVDSATCALLVVAGRHWFGARAGLIAGVLGAFYGPFLYFAAGLVPSTLFVFLAVAALTAGAYARPVAAGCLWALALAVRAEIIVAIPFVLIDAWWRGTPRTVWKTAAPIAAGVGLLLAANLAGGGAPVLFTTSGGVNLWLGNNPHADGVNPFIFGPLEPVADEVRARARTSVEADRIFRRHALAFIRQQPVDALRLAWKKLVWTLTDRELPNTDDIEWVTAHSWIFRRPLFPLSFGLVFPLAMAGAVLVGGRWRTLAPLLGLLATGIVTAVVFFTNARFRLIMVPPLLLLAASALDRLPALLRKGREDRLLLGRALLALAAGAFVTWGGFYGVRAYAVPQISVNTGALEREAGELEAAVRHLRAGLALYPRDVIGWIHLALALEQHGDVAAAAQAYRDAEELVPNDAELQRMAARFWARHPGEVGPPRYLDPAAPTLPRGATP